jgi:hypothetical protein
MVRHVHYLRLAALPQVIDQLQDHLPVDVIKSLARLVQYQKVRLLGFRGDVGPEVVTSFGVDKDLKDFPHGTIGIEVIGATMRALIPPREDAHA